jgi:hypothetical protein
VVKRLWQYIWILGEILMAKRDITGLLTGIPSGGIDPRVGMTDRQMLLQNAFAEQQRMAGGLRGMFGGKPTIQQQIAQAAGQKQRADEAKRKEQIKRVAEALPPEYSALAQGVIDEVQGALPKALEVLGRKKPEVKPTTGEKPTATDIKAAKKALSLAGEEAKGGEAFGFLGTDWNDAWNNQTEAAQDLLATQVAEVTNKLIKPPASLDLSEARKLAIQKMYTDNLTETGLFEWGKGESRMMTPNEIEEKQKQDLEARLNKY